MYRCGLCSEVVGPGERIGGRIPVEIRKKVYPFRPKAYRIRDWETGRLKWHDDPGGQGWEVVREVLACPACVQEKEA